MPSVLCCAVHRVTAQLQIGEDGLYLYRQMVHPDVKNLAFIGTAVTSNNYVLTTALQVLRAWGRRGQM